MNTERMGCMVIKTLYRIIKYFVRFFQMMKTQERVYLVLVSIISISIGVFPVISTLIFQEIINILQMSNSTIDYVLNLVLLYTLISVLQRILGVFSVYYEKKLKMRMAIGLDMSIVEKPGELTLKDFENANTYDIIQRASNINIEQVFSFFKAVMLMLSWVVMISPCHAVMRLPGYLSWNVPFDGAAVRPITKGISSYIHALPAL